MLACRNYKVYANIGPTTRLMCRSLAVLHTGTGQNLIKKLHIPRHMEKFIAYGPFRYITDANKHPTQTAGSTKMQLQLGNSPMGPYMQKAHCGHKQGSPNRTHLLLSIY